MKSYLVCSPWEYNIIRFLSFEIKIELYLKISNFIQIKWNNDWLCCVNSTSSPATFPLERALSCKIHQIFVLFSHTDTRNSRQNFNKTTAPSPSSRFLQLKLSRIKCTVKILKFFGHCFHGDTAAVAKPLNGNKWENRIAITFLFSSCADSF